VQDVPPSCSASPNRTNSKETFAEGLFQYNCNLPKPLKESGFKSQKNQESRVRSQEIRKSGNLIGEQRPANELGQQMNWASK
jgi:hypothetical protein